MHIFDKTFKIGFNSITRIFDDDYSYFIYIKHSMSSTIAHAYMKL